MGADIQLIKAYDIVNHITSTRGTTLKYHQSYGYIKPWPEWNKQNNMDSLYVYGAQESPSDAPGKFSIAFIVPVN